MFVYCKEAHPIDSTRPSPIATVEQPVTLKERRNVAKDFVEEFKLPFPSLLDTMDDTTGLAYAAHPDRMYLVGKDGLVAWAGEKGPKGFSAELLETAIKKELTPK